MNNTDLIKYEAPPNWEEIHEAFPAASLENQVFTYAPHIYTSKDLSGDLIAHELVHIRQQGDEPLKWWEDYIYSPEFRVDQEIEAYQTQYQYAVNFTSDREVLAKFLHLIASNLASEVYGKCISVEEAKQRIKNGL